MGCIYEIWTLEQVKGYNQIHANVKDKGDAIIFRSRDLKKVRQKLRLPNFDTSRFRGTESIKTTLKNNDGIISARSPDCGKILQFSFRKGYVDEI